MKNLFKLLVSYQMDEELDTEGRPLGEQRAFQLYSNIKTLKIKCNYPGSRFQNAKPINVSALKQIRENKNEVFYLFSRLRQHVSKKDNFEKLSYLDVWEIASRAILLPLFIKLNNKQQIPAYAAGLYKVAFGLISVAMKLTLKETRGEDLPVDPSYLFQSAENSGELIGAYEVCAAPEKLIKDVVHSIIYGDSLDKKTPAIDFLDIENFLDFSKNSVQFQFCFINYLIYIRNFYSPFPELPDVELNKKYELFQKEMKEKQEECQIPPVYQIEELLNQDDLKSFYRRLEQAYFPTDTGTLFSNPKDERLTFLEYEEQQLKTFNLLLQEAMKYTPHNPSQTLSLKDLHDIVNPSPLYFLLSREI